MKKYLFLAMICFLLILPSFFVQTKAFADSSNTVTASIPEEARKHFIMGETMFKAANTADDFAQAVSQFSQAALQAPDWPEARYNLALAKESAGDFSGAMDDLKIYQQFKLSDSEARTVQDKIYAIEAKQQLKVSDSAAKAASDSANVQAAENSKKEVFIKKILGNWSQYSAISITSQDNENVQVAYEYGQQSFQVLDVKVTDSTLDFTVDYIETGNPEHLDHYSLTLNNNDHLTGSYTRTITESGKAMLRQLGQPINDNVDVEDCDFRRQ